MPSKRTAPRASRERRDPDPPSALCVDLYELTMAQSYLERGLRGEATFGVWVRRLPPDWGFLVAAGWPRVLDFAGGLRFAPDDIAYLRSTALFRAEFLAALPALRWRGRMRAIQEGCPFFAGEPILEVTSPLPEAQLLETLALCALQLPILAATKAARCLEAARGRTVVDFAMRRAHGLDAAHQVARSAFLAGMAATSNVEAARRWDIPVVGTMAHSYVMAFASELDAFRAYADSNPEHCVLLVDTYDTLEGVRRAAQVGCEMRARGAALRGIRIDSGDLAELARQARALLDAADLGGVEILTSGGLDEHRIAALVERGAPIDGFGVGTGLGVPADAPTLDIVYKLVAYEGRPVAKQSPGKESFPGARQVWRDIESGRARGDRVGLAGEKPAADARSEPRALLVDAVESADAVAALRSARADHAAWLGEIPAGCRRLRRPDPYPVRDTPALAALIRQARGGQTGST